MRINRGVRQVIFFILSAVLLPASLAGQVSPNSDVKITALGPIRDLARNVNLQTVGTGGFFNNYIFTPTFADEGVCIGFTNNGGTNSGNFSVSFFGSTDQSVKGYQGNTGAWASLGPSSNNLAPALSGGFYPQVSLFPSSTANAFVKVAGQAQVAVVLTSTGSVAGSTATITMVESQNGLGCGNTTTGPVYCPITGIGGTTANGTNSAVQVGTAGKTIYVCNFTLVSNAGGQVTLTFSTDSTCATTGTTVFNTTTNTSGTNATEYTGLPLLGQIIGGAQIGRTLCITNETTANIAWNFSIAIF